MFGWLVKTYNNLSLPVLGSYNLTKFMYTSFRKPKDILSQASIPSQVVLGVCITSGEKEYEFLKSIPFSVQAAVRYTIMRIRRRKLVAHMR